MDYRDRWELKDYLAGQTLDRRIRLLQVGLVLLLVAFLLNFWYLQAVHGDEYANLAENNRLRRIPMLPTRGVIFDRHDEVLAAARPSLDLVLLRESRHDPDLQLRRLVEVLDAPYESLVARVQLSSRRPLYETLVLKEDVELEPLARIEARRELFPSVEVQQSTRRSYPHGDVYSHVLGYVGEVDDGMLAQQPTELHAGDIVGKSGLERTYDGRLRGARGWNLVSVNNLGRRMAGPWVGTEPVHGAALKLTLDHRLQEALRRGLDGEVGAGVFLDPWTGEVLALASSPAFDPSLFADGMTAEAWKGISENPSQPLHDRAIASYYAPGSVFKVLMAVAGLESGTIDLDHTVHCTGSTRVYNQQRLCWKRGGHGTVALREALAHSCNVYFYHLGKQLGVETIHLYGAQFGLGRPTGVDLPGEVAGILPSSEWKRRQTGEPWYPGDTISVAIGQGLLAVTPIQMARMLGVIATDGQLARPHLVRGNSAPAQRVDLRPETFRAIREALRDAVREGTGGRADLKTVAVAGKTGTAQVYKHSAGVDSDTLPKEERDHAWFAGYAPADDPKIAFAVVVEHGGHGGAAAAPVARQVLEVFFGETPGTDQAAGNEVEDVGTTPAG
jgi:penicillin-binding protein 2